MPGLANYQMPPPTKWEDLEDLCLDLWRKIWGDDGAQKYGRRGQPQEGVDIFGRPGGGAKWAAVQCKGKNEALGSALTKKELLAEVEKAKRFEPSLSEWVIVSTGPRDAGLQECARRLTDEHAATGLFSVLVWSWEDVLLRLNDYPDVAIRHFPHFYPVQQIKVAPHTRTGAEPDTEDDQPRVDEATLAGFLPPRVSARMLPRAALRASIERLLASDASVYLQASSGFGKSVLMSQLTLPHSVWINADEHREFAQFRQRLGTFVQAKYRGSTLPDAPRDLARALDRSIGGGIIRPPSGAGDRRCGSD